MMHKSSKTFCLVVLACLFLVLLYNALVWRYATRQLLSREGEVYTGELARMGYLSSYAHKRFNTVDLPKRHLAFSDYTGQQVDVVTIGDSFSQGVANGPNRFYQDYLASIQDLTVLNLSPHLPGSRNFIESVAVLINSGFMDTIRPKYLILQRVERNAYKLSREVDFQRTMPLEEVNAIYNGRVSVVDSDEPTVELPKIGFLNTGNFKWLIYNGLYPFSPNGFFSKVYRAKLDRSMFSGNNGYSLLFLYKDLNKFKSKTRAITPEMMDALNGNLNQLAELLRAKGITLVFLPAPDKLTLYRPYIADSPYPESRFFDLLRRSVRAYELIDAEDILSRELENGEKDVYWIDDTHWSWKASKAIFDTFRFPPAPGS